MFRVRRLTGGDILRHLSVTAIAAVAGGIAPVLLIAGDFNTSLIFLTDFPLLNYVYYGVLFILLCNLQ